MISQAVKPSTSVLVNAIKMKYLCVYFTEALDGGPGSSKHVEDTLTLILKRWAI